LRVAGLGLESQFSPTVGLMGHAIVTLGTFTDEFMLGAFLFVVLPGVPLLAASALWWARRSFLPLLLIVAFPAAIYLTAILVATVDDDAGGFIDCGIGCTTVQTYVAAGFWYGGGALALTGLFSIGALAVLAVKGELSVPRG
jgi:hypothetical protein